MNISFFSSDATAADALSLLRDKLPEYNIVSWPDLCDPLDLRYAICWGAPEQFFAGATRLKAIFSLAAGVDHLLTHPGLPDNVPLFRLADAGMADKIAEYVHFGVMRCHRQFDIYQKQQAQSLWQPQVDKDACDYHVGIMGMGIIGSKVASRLQDAGYAVCGWKRTEMTDGDTKVFVGESAVGEFLKHLDTLVCILPLTAKTTGIVDSRLLYQLPRGANFINVGRGGHIVEADLIDALNDGQLSGALLDVCDTEPPAPDHPFWKHPDLVLTPHIAGPTQLQESVNQIVENIRQIESGVVPVNLTRGLVENDRGY